MVEKLSEPNLAGFVHNKPQLRFVTELFLDMSSSHCVRFDAQIKPIYVVHNQHFENEIIIFRHGMAWLYSISRKRMGVGMDLMLCPPNEFPVSNVATSLTVESLTLTLWHNLLDSWTLNSKNICSEIDWHKNLSHLFPPIKAGKSSRSRLTWYARLMSS
jgi:hypothetical protein